jgi:hypothetical protein
VVVSSYIDIPQVSLVWRFHNCCKQHRMPVLKQYQQLLGILKRSVIVWHPEDNSFSRGVCDRMAKNSYWVHILSKMHFVYLQQMIWRGGRKLCSYQGTVVPKNFVWTCNKITFLKNFLLQKCDCDQVFIWF